MENISGVFDNKTKAEKAVSQLVEDGISSSDISLIMLEKTRDDFFSSKSDRIVKGSATGTAIGGVLGALIGGLTAVGSIAMTGGSILVVGPIVAALSGAGAGGIVGGVGGALTALGFSKEEANKYETAIKSGKALVIVNAKSPILASKARMILNDLGASTKAA